MANIVTFDKVDGPNGWLGSMYTSPIFYLNSLFATAEHLFQFTRFEGFYPKDKNGEPFRIKNDEGTLVAFDEIFMKSKLCAYRTDMIKSELETVKRKKATITDYTKSGVQRTKDLSVQYVSNPLFAKSTAKKYLKYVRNYSKLTDDEKEAAYKKDEEKDLANMRKILRLKVGFNSELIGQLLRTGDAIIIESPRVLRRPPSLRRWSHDEEINEVFPRGSGTCCADGVRVARRPRIAMGSH